MKTDRTVLGHAFWRNKNIPLYFEVLTPRIWHRTLQVEHNIDLTNDAVVHGWMDLFYEMAQGSRYITDLAKDEDIGSCRRELEKALTKAMEKLAEEEEE